MNEKDLALFISPLLAIFLGWYLKGRYENDKLKGDIHKSGVEGVILTAGKIEEYVNALIETKMQMHEINVQLADCMNDRKKCAELKEKLTEAIRISEENAEEAIRVLRLL